MIQKSILEYLSFFDKSFFWQNDSFGIKGRKRENRYRPNGVPDIIGVANGIFIGIEVKTASGKMLESQKIFRQKFVECGGIYIVARSVDDVKEILKIKKIVS